MHTLNRFEITMFSFAMTSLCLISHMQANCLYMQFGYSLFSGSDSSRVQNETTLDFTSVTQ